MADQVNKRWMNAVGIILLTVVFWLSLFIIAQPQTLTGFAPAWTGPTQYETIGQFTLNLPEHFQAENMNLSYYTSDAKNLDIIIKNQSLIVTPEPDFTGQRDITLYASGEDVFIEQSITLIVNQPGFGVGLPPASIGPVENITEINETPAIINETEEIIIVNVTENITGPVPIPVENITEENITIEPAVNQTTIPTIETGLKVDADNILRKDSKFIGRRTADGSIEIFFDTINKTNTTLILEFHHNSTQTENILVETQNFTLDKNQLAPGEIARLEIPLVQGIIPRFNLKVGVQPGFAVESQFKEILEIGKIIPDVQTTSQYRLIDRNDQKLNIQFNKNQSQAVLQGINVSSVRTDIGPTQNSQITTPAIASERFDIEQAVITLEKTGEVNVIMGCLNIDVDNFTCLTGWHKTDIPFTDNGTHITFTVDRFSGYAGAEIEIINVQSYPTVGGNWTVTFNTTGTANLTITAINGTTWSDSTEENVDLKFFELKCGDSVLDYTWFNNSVFYQNYSCSQTSSEISKVLTAGKHALEFRFGQDVDYAFNQAGANLSCAVRQTSCNTGETPIMRMSSTANAHAELVNGTDYDYIVCCKDSTNRNTLTNSSGTNILDLSSATDAHAEVPGQTDYAHNVFINSSPDPIYCTYENVSGSCSGNKKCLLTISDYTDAHVADCVTDPYNLSICCQLNYTLNFGDTITSDTTLTENLTGSGTGIYFGADNIYLDCSGFYLIGDSTGIGINASNRQNVIIRNCNFEPYNFSIDILYENCTNCEIHNTDVTINISNSNNDFVNQSDVDALYVTNSNNTYVLDSPVRNYSFNNANFFRLSNSTFGEIKFLESITESGTNLIGNSTSDIRIQTAALEIFVNSASQPGLNKSSNITARLLPFSSTPNIYADRNDDGSYEEKCTAPTCNIFSYDIAAGDLYFNSTHFTTYKFGTNAAPTQDTPILNSTTINNQSNENLTVYPQNVLDVDGNNITNITNWYVNNTSITVLNHPFDTNINFGAGFNDPDYSPYNNYATWLGTPGTNPANWVANGKSGGAFNFSSSNSEMISIPDSNTIDMDSSFSVEFWMYMATGGTYTILGKFDSLNSAENYNFETDASNILYFRIANSTGSVCSANTNPLGPNNWYHVVGVYDQQTGNVSIYLDGSQAQATSCSLNISDCTTNYALAIGAYDNGGVPSFFFNGKIDELKIYNRSLSSQQISQNYNSGTPKYNKITSQETVRGEVWYVNVTPNDATTDGNSLLSNNITIENTPPTTPTVRSPANHTRTSSTWVLLNCSGSTDEDNDIINYTFYGDQTDGSTFLGGSTTGIYNWTVTGTDIYYWKCNAYDGFDYSANTTVWQFGPNNIPTQNTPILNSTFGTNYTSENLTVYPQNVQDADSDPVETIINWFVDGISILVLNLPFMPEETTVTKDYTPYQNNGTLDGATWQENGASLGYYWFDSAVKHFSTLQNDFQGYNIEVKDHSSLDLTDEITIEGWFKPNTTFDSTAPYYQGLLDKGAYQIYLDKSDGKLKAALNLNSTKTWKFTSGGLFNGDVNAMTVWNNTLIVGGGFTTFGSRSLNHTAQWNGSTWLPLGSGLNDTVYTLAVYEGDLVAGGDFITTGDGGTSLNALALWDGSAWSTFNGGCIAGGGTVPPAVNALTTYDVHNLLGTSLSISDSYDYLVVGGDFGGCGNYNPVNDPNIACWNGTNFTSHCHSALDSGSINTLAVYRNILHAGGSFTTLGANTPVADKIGFWNTSVSPYDWDPMGTAPNGNVDSMAVYKDELYVGGGFTTMDGQTVNYIARWNGTGWKDLSGGVSGGVTGVNALAVWNGDLYVGGTFTSAGHLSCTNLAVWNGSNWTSCMNLGTINGIKTLANYQNNLWAGFDATGSTDYHARVASGDEMEIASATDSWSSAWHYFALTYDNSQAKLYINGNLENTLAASGLISTNNHSIYIGSSLGSRIYGGASSNEERFSGSLDEIKIYNRALSPEQIAANYNSGTPNYTTIVSQETSPGQVWHAEVTVADRYDNGSTLESNNLTVQCGILTQNTTLTEDIVVSGGLSCFTIGANNIELDCAGHSITGSNAGNGITVFSRTYITIKNCRIYNFTNGFNISASFSNFLNNTLNNNSYGVYYSGSNNIWANNTMENNINSSFYGSGFSNDRFTNNIFSRSRTNAGFYSKSNPNRIIFINNTFSHNKEYGYYAHAQTNNILNAYFADNKFINNTNPLVLQGCCGYDDNITIIRNNFTQSTGHAIQLQRLFNSVISNNTISDFTGSSTYGIYTGGGENISIEHNTFTGYAGSSAYGIYISGSGVSGEHNISFNQITDNINTNGITIAGPDLKITNNTIINNSGSNGIYFTDSISNFNISGNRIENYSNALSSSTGLNTGTIANNIVRNNTNGLYLWDVQNTNFTDNIVQNNSQYGYYLFSLDGGSLGLSRISGQGATGSGTYDLYIYELDNIELIDAEFDTYNLFNSKLKIENTTTGSIKFTGEISATGTDLIGNSTSDIRLNSNNFFVDSASQPGFNVSANLTINGITGLTNPIQYVTYDENDWQICSPPTCYNLSYVGTTYTFNTTHFTTFKIDSDFSAPDTTLVVLNSTTGTYYPDDNLTCYAQGIDTQSDIFTAYYTWYNNTTPVLSGSIQVFNNTLTLLSTLASGNTSGGETWTCSVFMGDGLFNETDTNNASVNIINPAQCGDTLQANTQYVMTSDDSTAGNCFTIGGDNVVLDCQGYKITGPTSSGTAFDDGGGNPRLNFTLKNCFVQDFQYGVHDHFADSMFYNNTFNSTRYYSFYINQENNNNITANTFSNVGYTPTYSNARPLYISNADNTIVQGNNFSSNYAEELWLLSDSDNFVFKNNVIDANSKNNEIIYMNDYRISATIEGNNITNVGTGLYSWAYYVQIDINNGFPQLNFVGTNLVDGENASEYFRFNESNKVYENLDHSSSVHVINTGQFAALDSNNLTIRNNNFTNHYGDANIFLFNVDNSNISNNNLSKRSGTAYTYHLAELRYADNLTFANNELHDTYSNGINLEDSTNANILNNNVDVYANAMQVYDANNYLVEDNLLEGNIVSTTNTYGFRLLGDASHGIIRNNTMEGGRYAFYSAGTTLADLQNITIENNLVKSGYYNNFFVSAGNMSIINNTFSSTRNVDLVYFTSSSDSYHTFANNTFEQGTTAYSDGVYIKTSNLKIHNNNVTGPSDFGFNFDGGTGTNFPRSNVTTDNTVDGKPVYYYWKESCPTISNLNIDLAHVSSEGIALVDMPDNCVISNNNISGTGIYLAWEKAISLINTNHTNITNNDFQDFYHSMGFTWSLEPAEDLYFAHNNIESSYSNAEGLHYGNSGTQNYYKQYHTIHNNTFNDLYYSIYRVSDTPNSWMNITGNYFNATDVSDIYLYRAGHNNTLENNIFDNFGASSNTYAIAFWSNTPSDNLVRNNNFTNGFSSSSYIYVQDGQNNNITSNYFNGSAYAIQYTAGADSNNAFSFNEVYGAETAAVASANTVYQGIFNNTICYNAQATSFSGGATLSTIGWNNNSFCIDNLWPVNGTVTDDNTPLIQFNASNLMDQASTSCTALIDNIASGTNSSMGADQSNQTIQTNRTLSDGNRELNITCLDQYDDTAIPNSIIFEVSTNLPPIVNQLVLNSSLGTNSTDENLTLYYTAADPDNHSVTNITAWYKNTSAINLIYLPFEANDGSESTTTEDYIYSNNGTVANALWNSTGGQNGFGAYQFNGANTMINVTHDSVFSSNEDISISMWVKPAFTLNTGSPTMTLISKGASGTDIPFRLHHWGSESSGSIQFYIGRASSGASAIVSSYTMSADWHHIVGTWDGTTARLYVDGLLIASNSGGSGSRDQNTHDIVIGRYGYENSKFFNGTIDEIQIFNHTLTPEQILILNSSRTDIIASEETAEGEIWQACVTPNDGIENGAANCSNNLTVLGPLNEAPNTTQVILNSTNGTNYTDEDLYCYANATDADNDTLTFHYGWYKDGATQPSLEGSTSSGLAQGQLHLVSTVTSGNTSKGEIWSCYVKADDSTENETGWTDSGNLTIRNTAPTQNDPWIAAQQPTGTDADDNLVSYWQFEKASNTSAVAIDAMGLNNGTIYSHEPDYTEDGRIGSAYNFNGVDDYVDAGSLSSLNNLHLSNFTVTAWVKQDSDSFQTIIGKTDGSSSGWYLYTFNDHLKCWFYTPTAGYAEDSAFFPNSTWVHVALVLENNQPKLYTNGQEVSYTSQVNTGGIDDDSAIGFYIGQRNSATYWNGSIDDVLVFNRSLSDAEILDIYLDANINDSSIISRDQDLAAASNNTNDTDANESITRIYNWYKNGTSITVLNMPFESNKTATTSNLIRDYTSYQNNGTISGTISWIDTGKLGGAYDFATDGNKITIAQDPSINFTLNDNYTIEFWMNASYDWDSADAIIEKWGPTGVGYPFVFRTYNSTNRKSIQWAMYNGSAGNGVYTSASVLLNDSQWHHIVGVKDGNNMLIYRDGNLDQNITITVTGQIENERDLCFGVRCDDNAVTDYQGQLDEVRIYNFALTTAQIQAHYNLEYNRIVKQETSVNETWYAEITLNDLSTNTDSATKQTQNATIKNRAPEAPTLLIPLNNDTLINRSPEFIWENARDKDKDDNLTYQILVDDSSAFDAPEINITAITEGTDNTSYTAAVELDTDKVYYWKVRANDSYEYGDFSTVFNFTLFSQLSINLTRSTVNFGQMYINQNNDTSDNSPQPFLVENTGNIYTNITINGTAFFTQAAFPSNYYMYKIDINETGAFDYSQSTTTYAPVNITGQLYDIASLNWRNSNDTAEIDINITVPEDEPAGQKTANITLTAS